MSLQKVYGANVPVLQGLQYKTVCLVHYRRVQGGKVDAPRYRGNVEFLLLSMFA